MAALSRVLAVVVASISVVIPSALSAQRNAAWELGLQVMSSPDVSKRDLWFGGQIEGIRQSAVALRASTDLLHLGPVRLRYSAQLLPVAMLSGTERYQKLSGDGRTIYVLGGVTRSIGVGLVPVGLDLGVDLGSRLRAQVGGAAGIMRFSQNIPVAGARQRNFTAEADAMLLWNAGDDRWLQLGLRWKHISNGYTAYENPGIDNRMLVAGFSTTLRRRR